MPHNRLSKSIFGASLTSIGKIVPLSFLLLAICMGGLTTTGCSSDGEKREGERRVRLNPFVDERRVDRRFDKLTAQELYLSGKSALDAGDASQALEIYEALETRHPFTKYATQAQLDTIFAHKRSFEPEAAISSANRFLRQHPSHPDIEWVYYIKGVINFERSRDEWEKLFQVESFKRDPVFARLAFEDFALLIKRFPESQYASDARQRMVFLRDELAKYELNVARFYMKRKAWVAASRRAKHVVEHYQGTTSVAGSLDVLNKAYTKLGLLTQAEEAQTILDTNFPNYDPGLQAQTEGFLRRLWPFGNPPPASSDLPPAASES